MSNLKRYNVEICRCDFGVHLDTVADSDGEWVKFEDIKHLLPTGAQQPQGEICQDCGGSGVDNGLGNYSRLVRCRSCKGLGKLSPHAAPVVPQLAKGNG